MHLKAIELSGFKSFAKKSSLEFSSPIAGVVGPNGSGKSNAAEAFRFVLGEQSMKAMRGKRGPDMIWIGNDRIPRANRARVALRFNNANRLLDLDFDEVIIERAVHRDGANEYAINGSKVRLKDIAELLASANIGASGHHIISQGEADRILGASPRERREMIEDALGLKAFQYRKRESEKKLAQVDENVKEASLLRRELAPHVKFLEKQMQKLARSRELKEQIKEALTNYIAREKASILQEGTEVSENEKSPKTGLQRITETLAAHEDADKKEISITDELNALDERIAKTQKKHSALENALGRVEGKISLVDSKETTDVRSTKSIPFDKVSSLITETTSELERVQQSQEMGVLQGVVRRLKEFLTEYESVSSSEGAMESPALLAQLTKEKTEIEEELSALQSEEAALAVDRADVLARVRMQQEQEKEAQREFFELKDKKRELEQELRVLAQRSRELENRKSTLEVIIQEAGFDAEMYEGTDVPAKEEQEEAYREIERLQVRLDEAGFVDDDTVREYEETKERDSFLEREIQDLTASKQSLLEVIKELDEELISRFGAGLKKINTEFKNFFSMLFDGGEAQLQLVQTESEEEEEEKAGIDIQVRLPRKKIMTLDMLSGGERALTSIALIFAMSQVNPPPFIILDETDAALDEANSQKYAQMVQELSKRSQLILITHNRQTMEAAGELYGVTMGSDGVSKLLSVKFDEAVSVAK